MSRRARRALAIPALGLVLAAAAAALVDRWLPPPLGELARPAAVAVLDADGRPLRLFLPADERWRLPVGLDELPAELPAAVIAVEDRRFYRHPGIDPLAILRAAWQNLRAGRVVSGGSTLTMQLARLADPAPRTLAAKLREAWRALQLERRFSKRELLELYLNVAPYGGNLEGVGAASRFYFGREPARLSAGEIALLVALPRAPTAYDPLRRPEAARAARDRVLDRLAAAGVITPRQAADGRRQPLPRHRRPTPLRAPHFARWAAGRAPGEARVATTLDPFAQQIAEAQVARHVPGLRRQGITQAAVVVIETRGRRLRAWVGSAGFLEPGRAGQVDGAVARRSPGSTLKPFLYALAVERGDIVPEAYLLDVPTDYAGYVAENYDGRYHGRVTARAALRRSLNAPAVRLLARIGLAPFHGLLARGGISTLDRPLGGYGLPLVLGAGEVSLLELTNLYAALADGGRYLPLAWRAEAPADSPGHGAAGERLVSRETAWLITETLREVERPDLPAAWRLARDVPAVAWKTGTSYGHRDAWAVGYSGGYAIGVWVGNFDGAARQGISGAEHAAPLLFDLFRALEPGGAEPGRPAGLRIESLQVCALSHQLPGAWCPERARVDYLPGRSRLERCRYHRRVRVPEGAGPGAFRQVVRYPPELVAWWRREGQPLPPQAVLAAAGLPGEGPRIVSPDAATPYQLRRDAPPEHQRLPLVARAGVEVERLYWYDNGLLVASGAPGETLFLSPTPGRHRLVVTDDLGRSDSSSYEVGGTPGAPKSR